MMIKDAEDSTREKLGDNEGNKFFVGSWTRFLWGIPPKFEH